MREFVFIFRSSKANNIKSSMKREAFSVVLLNELKLWIKLLLVLMSLVQTHQSNTYNILTSMQQTNQTFIAYLPYLQNCNYSVNSNISQGSVVFEISTPLNLFQYYQQTERIAFWSSISNGLDIFLQESFLLSGYTGIIYAPQIFNQDQNNLSENNTNDVVTIFKTYDNGNLTLFFVQVSVDMANNFTIQSNIVQQIPVNLTSNLTNLISSCNAVQQKIVISQLAQMSYIGTCLNSSEVFFFSLNSNYSQQILDLSTYNMSMPINNMILNPIMEIDGVNENGWNVFLLTNGNKQTYFCLFDPLNPENFTALNSSEFSLEFQELIQKLWSEQIRLETIKIEKLIEHLGPGVTQMFPGVINSIYIDMEDNVYIQSLTQDKLTYFSVYSWDKTQILNTSFYGNILLYNELQFLVENYQSQGQLAIMYVTLPTISFEMNQVLNGTYSLTIPCVNGVGNLTINWDIFVSNMYYPSSATFQVQQLELQANISVYTFQLFEYFKVFGPGYTVYFKGPPNLEATLLDASIISMSAYVLSIVEIMVAETTANTLFRSTSVTYTTQDGVYVYNGKGHRKMTQSPCGIRFDLRGLKINDEVIYYGYLDDTRSNLIYCICPTNAYKLKNCQSTQQSTLRNKISTAKDKLASKIDKLQQLSLFRQSINGLNEQIAEQMSDIPSNYDQMISNRLFTLVDQSLLLTIFNNNSAVLTNFWTSDYYDIVTIQCNQLQSLVGVIFLKEFYDPILNLFCEVSEYMYQYKVRNNRLVFHRTVPLYGFVTSDTSNVLVGFNYIFVQVHANDSPNQNSTININPRNNHCCVLRIDPIFDTVSVIKQVIFANSILQVYNYAGVDVAYYQGSNLTEDDSFLKVYLDATWLALAQKDISSAIQTYNFQVAFTSINYNVASQFSVNITYNMTTMIIYENIPPLPQTLSLNQIFTPFLPEMYSETIAFNYNGIQGPIVDASIISSNVPEMIEDVELNQLVIQRKIIGTVGNEYLQVFTPMDGKSNTTFDNAIIIVGSNQLEVYLKNFNNQEMFLVSTFDLKYQNCKYYTYQVLNLTSIQFVSECEVPEFNLEIPILILNLTIVNSTNVTLGANLILGTTNVRLSNIKTLVFQNATYILGIDEGPMESLTGKLRYCSSTGACSVLYNSSEQYFLLYYDVFVYDINEFVVVSLDFQYIQVWINPPIPDNTTTNPSIPYSYIIYIPEYIDEYISVITLINATKNSFTAILSGSQSYYEVIYSYSTQQLTINTIFQRYANCQTFDQFPVNVLLDSFRNLQALIAECSQNYDTLRLQTYQRLTSNSIVIFTGYLQLYTKYGPTSYLSTQTIPAYNPIHILKLSNTMINQLFLLYRNELSQIKLVYQKIDGILADNYVFLQPSVSITLSPLTTQVNFPTLFFTVQNDFYSINYPITTIAAPINQLTSEELIFLVIFFVCNGFTLIVMIFYWIYSMKSRPKKEKISDRQLMAANSWSDEEQTFKGFKDFREKFKQRITGLSTMSKKFSVRKHTQIQLFTTRHQ